MFKLSKGAEYAVRGILYLAMQPRDAISYIEEIAGGQGVPRAYLAKIFQTLSKKGFVRSTRGPGGGFCLTREPGEISLLAVIEAMEGSIHLNECLIRPGYCERDNTCPVHDVWQEAQERLVEVLSGCSLADLARAGEKKLKSAGL